MLNDPLADTMSLILNNELIGRSECMIKPVSRIIKDLLRVMRDNEYVGDFTEIEDSRGNYIILKLKGNINKCGVIKPRYSVKNNELEKFERRYLPAKDFGILFVSTSKGIITHYDSKSKKIGGRLLAYCY
ncbi:MAG: 30S ribosomal protein S8 [Candidatus Woesearchaeota archaeon]|nr:30S ribosomal protein S8 [Candidatus Woesearchaeota archaeon]|tara:strand:- start:9222 stop:9611 length:390 start_codon:yes stop_codon:yes gene_type:complete